MIKTEIHAEMTIFDNHDNDFIFETFLIVQKTQNGFEVFVLEITGYGDEYFYKIEQKDLYCFKTETELNNFILSNQKRIWNDFFDEVKEFNLENINYNEPLNHFSYSDEEVQLKFFIEQKEII